MPNPPRRTPALARFARLLPLLPALLLTWYVYRDVASFGFVNYDDPLYVAQNPRVTGGLSPPGIAWAFTSGEAGVWIPVTRLSFQLDASLAGPGPAGFHRTNLALHLLNVGLVYLLALALTRSAAGAAVAAGFFGVHPVNVEAVAWVTARKDLLMTTFLAGAALALLRARNAGQLTLVGLLAAAALLAKPAAVIAGPLLLLTARLGSSRAEAPSRDGTSRPWRPDAVLAVALVAAAGAVSLVAMRLAPAADLATRFHKPLAERTGEALVGVFRYLGRLAWPADLAVRYPESAVATSAMAAVGAGLGLLALGYLGYRLRRRWPVAVLGCGWFLLCLVPSLGIVQGGQLPLSDRYAYVAAIGLWLALAAAVAGARSRHRAAGIAVIAVAGLLVVAAVPVAARQAATWRDDESFWRHALAVNAASELPHLKLGEFYAGQGRSPAARQAYEAALQLVPRADTHVNAGNACLELGEHAAAEAHFRGALQLTPRMPEASLSLGALLAQRGDLAGAREVLLAAEGAQPGIAALQYNLALVAFLGGDADEARDRCRRALALDAAHVGARELLARLDRP